MKQRKHNMNNMNRINFKSMLLLVAFSFLGQANAQDFATLKKSIKFWTGTGTDSGAVIVTFKGDGFSDSGYVWGILFDDSISGAAALQTIADADINFGFVNQGGFLDSVTYNSLEGNNGVNNFWWNTFHLENGTWEFNSGLNAFIQKHDVYGLSYTDSDPNTWEPYRLPVTNPTPALNPDAVSISIFENNGWRWFGEGNSKALLFVDFDPLQGGKSFVFGVKFDDSITGLGLLQAISAQDSIFQIHENGFLNDIIYYSDSGIGGAPNYWGTWSATNFGNWNSNMGISEKVFDGGFFACTYTDFSPALKPDYPHVVEAPEGENNNTNILYANNRIAVKVYPNPCTNKVTVESQEDFEIKIFSIDGRQIMNSSSYGTKEIKTAEWQVGVYFMIIQSQKGASVVRIIKE